MKKSLLHLAAAAIFLISCGKKDSGSTPKPTTPEPAAITTTKTNFYLQEPVKPVINGNTGFSYSWDFGDGTAKVNAVNPSHSYTKAGIYTITLTGNNITLTKRVKVYIGMASVTVKNNFDKPFTNLYVSNFDDKDYMISHSNIIKSFAIGNVTDTMFVNVPANSTGFKSTADFFYVNNNGRSVNFIYQPASVQRFTHNTLVVDGKATGIFYYFVNGASKLESGTLEASTSK